MPDPEKNLYFVAIVPPPPVRDEVQELRLYFSEKYGSSQALKSPPHITLLAPFNTSRENENKIKSILTDFSSGYEPFDIGLKDFSTFSTKVIYVSVQKNEQLSIIQDKLESRAREDSEVFHYNYKKRSFHPHMTLAFRDLSKENFRKAWDEFKGRKFKASFRAASITLLKHDGSEWEIKEEFGLGKTEPNN